MDGSPSVRVEVPSDDGTRYTWDPRELLHGNRVDLLCDGSETYPAMLSAIGRAEAYVHLETYIFRSDGTGERVASALRARARAGVRVRVLYDSLGSLSIDTDFVDRLRDDGAEVIEYYPLWRRGIRRLGRRDHRKIIVIDGRVAFTGGLNIGDEYAPREWSGSEWHDMHVRVEGPVVAELDQTFRRIWVRAGGTLPEPVPCVPSPSGSARVMMVDNQEAKDRMGIRRAYLHAIGQARHTIRIMNAYFIPDLGIRWAIRRAIKRGVAVEVIVPEHSDVRAVYYSSRYLFSSFLRMGVRIFEWPRQMMHAKTAVIDGIWTAVGSYNLDYRSLFYNLEVVLTIIDRDLGARMDRQFDADRSQCRKITLATWRKRPGWQKLLEWLFFRLRRWL